MHTGKCVMILQGKVLLKQKRKNQKKKALSIQLLHSLRHSFQIRNIFQSKSINIFLISPQNDMLWYSLQSTRRVIH